MKTVIYAGSIRPGGGLTVVQLLVEALANDESIDIIVYTGAADASRDLRPMFEAYERVSEVRFLPWAPAALRYLLAKFYFLVSSLFREIDAVISINYYLPVKCNLFVYHINLLHYLTGEQKRKRTWLDLVKDFDAGIACRFADLNAFESEYLLAQAQKKVKYPIRRPEVLYVGVDPAFCIDGQARKLSPRILVVSSTQEHKDNKTALKALDELRRQEKNVPWQLDIVGGQSIGQWDSINDLAEEMQLDQWVKIHGPIPKIALNSLMHNSLCLLSTSLVESFCMVALEAMAAGCPAIVADSTAMPESVGEAGIIVPAGDSIGFAGAILRLWRDDDLREALVEKGLERAETYSQNAIRLKLRELLRSSVEDS